MLFRLSYATSKMANFPAGSPTTATAGNSTPAIVISALLYLPLFCGSWGPRLINRSCVGGCVRSSFGKAPPAIEVGDTGAGQDGPMHPNDTSCVTCEVVSGAAIGSYRKPTYRACTMSLVLTGTEGRVRPMAPTPAPILFEGTTPWGWPCWEPLSSRKNPEES